DALRGLHLRDLAIHRTHVGSAADHVLVLLGAVELNHHVALVDRAAGFGQTHDTQTGNLRRLEDHRARALHIAANPDRHHKIALANASHRDFDLRGSRVAVGCVYAADAHYESHGPGDDLHP